jgi:crystallin, alpha B
MNQMMKTFDPMAAHMMDHFGLGIHPEELLGLHNRMMLPASQSLLPTGYNRNWAMLPRREQQILDENARTKMTTAKDGSFQVCVDVHHFKPNEIHVSTKERNIVIEGKHEERTDDHGVIERKFVRKYTLPEGYDVEHLDSSLSSDGILTVKAPPPPAVKGGQGRILPIHHTGPAHLTVKDHQKAEVKAHWVD